MKIFNTVAHDCLVTNGYKHEHYEETFDERGDAENGPMLHRCQAYDEYTSAEDYIIIPEDGDVFIDRNFEMYNQLLEDERDHAKAKGN